MKKLFVNALCDKYQLNFFSGNGDWYFYYPNGKEPFTWQNRVELKRYRRKLAKALSYEFSSHQEIGSYLEIYAPHKITRHATKRQRSITSKHRRILK
jgi:hypothetical protein